MNNNCQIFTPSYIVEEMLDLIDYKDNILEKYVLDNSCGDGNLIVEIARRYIISALKHNKSKKQIVKDLSIYIVGIEIDSKLVEICKCRLTAVAKEYGINNKNWRIYCEDGLKFDYEESFDYIVGNPPYIAYAMLSLQERLFVKENFESCFYGKFDYSYAFIEKCLNLLNDEGKMVFITPSNMFKTQFGRELREIMLPYITKIVDYSFEKVFKEVLTSPAITIFNKNAGDTFIYKLKTKNKQIKKNIVKSALDGKWCFLQEKLNGDRVFGDYFKVSNSIATLCNDVYVIDDKIVQRYNIEKDAIREAISPKSQKYGKKRYIIFPYIYIKNYLVKYNEDEYKEKFPNAYRYLLENKETLKKTNKDKGSLWFEYGRSQALMHLNQSKLLISTIVTNEIMVYELTEKQIPYSGMFIVPIQDLGLDVAKQVLENEETKKYLKSLGIVLSGNSVRISTKDIEKLKF